MSNTNTIKFYQNLTQSKTGEVIPVFFDNKPMHSKYNPTHEALNFSDSILPNTKFVMILGIGGGYHIKAIADRFSQIKILAVEYNEDDFNFVKNIDCVKNLQQNKNITFCTINNVQSTLKNLYIPAIYGDLQILIHRAWANYSTKAVEILKQRIESVIKEISADYSVQSHFGKIWQKNIFSNLLFFEKKSNLQKNGFNWNCKIDTQKTAAIIAAGPSLDTTINELKSNRASYFIISTDTAFDALVKNKVYPEIVVSIDGQNISYSHFMCEIPQTTSFIFDLCANPVAVRKCYNSGAKVLLTQSGHPLSSMAGNFIFLDSGAGTVTIAAADFARKAGFNKIKTFGADFSYSEGKPYTKGTYLEAIYNSKSDRFLCVEKQYCTLMFRTELILKDKEKRIYTTNILNSYKETFENWQKNASENIVQIKNPEKINMNCFIKKILTEKQYSFLPYIAFLRRTNPNNCDYENLLKLAQSSVLRYNR